MALEHRLRLQPGLDSEVLLGAAAVWLDGWIEDGRTGDGEWWVQPLSSQEIQLLRRHPGSPVDPERSALGLYHLMVGFYRAGLDVELQGDWSAAFPSWKHDQRPALKIRPLYQDQLPAEERQPELDLEFLGDLQRRLPGAPRQSLRQQFEVRSAGSRTEWFLRHPSGVEVVALLGRKGLRSYKYCLPAATPLCLRLSPWNQVRPARTWGEAWIGHFSNAHCRLPQGLAILPDEVAILVGSYLTRYRVEDRSTLNHLEVLEFGSGRSPLFDAEGWLQLAQTCGETQKYRLAAACCEQALTELPEAAAERQRWLGWLEFRQNPPPTEPERKIRVRPLAELIRRTGADELEEVAEEIRTELYDAHDYRRQPFPLRQRIGPGLRLVYANVTGAELLKAGVSAHQLARLGYRCNPIPPPEIFADLFTIRFEHHLLWGNVSSASFILQSNSDAVYRG